MFFEFKVMNKYRSHNCNELRESDTEKKVTLAGWINRKREHGNVLFIDLRDHYGITQCVIEKSEEDLLNVVNNLRVESVIKVIGKVIKRASDTINESLDTGKVELLVEALEILSRACLLYTSPSPRDGW